MRDLTIAPDIVFPPRTGRARGHAPPKDRQLTESRIDLIDKNTHEIRQDEDQVVYKSLEEIAEDLPDHAPRFVLLSYPLTMVRGMPPLS